MTFEWDDNKRLTNINKHGIDFIDVPAVFEGDILTVEDNRFDYGEQRFIAVGRLQSCIVVVVFTKRENRIRIISARKASRNERQAYLRAFSD